MPKICPHVLSDSRTIFTNHANACCRNGLKFSEIVKRTLESPHYSQRSVALSIGERERRTRSRCPRPLTASGVMVRCSRDPVQSSRQSIHPPVPASPLKRHAQRPGSYDRMTQSAPERRAKLGVHRRFDGQRDTTPRVPTTGLAMPSNANLPRTSVRLSTTYAIRQFLPS